MGTEIRIWSRWATDVKTSSSQHPELWGPVSPGIVWTVALFGLGGLLSGRRRWRHCMRGLQILCVMAILFHLLGCGGSSRHPESRIAMQTEIPSSRAFNMEAFKMRSASSAVICMPFALWDQLGDHNIKDDIHWKRQMSMEPESG